MEPPDMELPKELLERDEKQAAMVEARLCFLLWLKTTTRERERERCEQLGGMYSLI